MRDLFAIDDTRADLSYVNTRAPRHRGAERAKDNCDDLWRDFEPYASAHFLAEFPYHFHQRWFEMYVAVALLRAGLHISCPDRAAPDVRVHHRDGLVLWIEATAPTGGNESNPVYSQWTDYKLPLWHSGLGNVNPAKQKEGVEPNGKKAAHF